MALISPYYSTQAGSYAMLSRRLLPTSWSEEVKLKPFVTIKMVGRLNSRTASWKRHFFARRTTLLTLQRDVKNFKVLSALEGSSQQNDESRSRSTSGSIVSWNFINIADVAPNQAEETTTAGSSKIQDQSSPLSYNSREEESTIRSLIDIDEFFEKFLMMLLRSHAPNQSTDRGIFWDSPPPPQGNVSETTQNQFGSQEDQKTVKILKAIWPYCDEFFQLVILLLLYFIFFLVLGA